MPTKCIILAAGVGSRLRPLTNDMPKCCLRITDECSLIERVVQQLIKFTNVSEITVCVGFKSEKIIDRLSQTEFNIRYCYNADFETTNNMYSAWLALRNNELGDDIIILNADCVYDDSILQKLDSIGRSTILYDPIKWDTESMKITIEDSNRVTNISKAITKDDNSFVSIDLYKIMSHDLPAYLSSIEDFMQRGDLNSWNELAIYQMIKSQGSAMYGLNIETTKWFEIDTLKDYQDAKKIFDK